MSKHHHGKPHLTKAQIAAHEEAARHEKEKQRITASNEARTDAIFAARERSGREMAPQLALWQREVSAMPISDEVEISPLKVPMLVISQYDDIRRRPNGKTYLHTAFDGQPATPVDNPEVVAMVTSKILYVGEYDPAAGITVVAGAGNTMYYSYSHLKSISVKVGDTVAQGGTIGILGNSGNAKDIEGGCVHVAVHAPDESLKAGLLNVSLPSGFGDSPDSLQAAGVKLLPHYKRIWPSINGQLVHKGTPQNPVIIQPGKPPAIAPTISTFDTATLEAMRRIIIIDPGLVPLDLAPNSLSILPIQPLLTPGIKR